MKLVQKQPSERSRSSRRSGDVLAEGIRKERRPFGFFSKMTNDELISYAKKIIEENGIKNKNSLGKADRGLHDVLRKRKLLDVVIPENQHRDWSSMPDEELIRFSRRFIEENGIKNKNSLAKADRGLYGVLRRRNILDVIIPDKYGRDWSSMADEELIQFAKKFIEENGIKNRRGLSKNDIGLYAILLRRKLLDAVIPKKQKHRDPRDWSSMSDDSIIQLTEKLIKEKQIKNAKQLYLADQGLYVTLRNRRLLDIIFTEKRKCRKWSSMPNNGLIPYAKKFIEENGIANKKSLQEADLGLYRVLWRRNLLSAVFSDIEQAKKTEAVKQVVDAMKEFGGSE